MEDIKTILKINIFIISVNMINVLVTDYKLYNVMKNMINIMNKQN